MPCPHVTATYPASVVLGLPELINCAIVDGIVGLRWGLPKPSCSRCAYAKGDDAYVKAVVKKIVVSLLIRGDLPRFPDKIDLRAMFVKFAVESTIEEQKKLIGEMYEFQSRYSEEDGGHPAETLVMILDDLARAFVGESLPEVLDGLGITSLGG